MLRSQKDGLGLLFQDQKHLTFPIFKFAYRTRSPDDSTSPYSSHNIICTFTKMDNLQYCSTALDQKPKFHKHHEQHDRPHKAIQIEMKNQKAISSIWKENSHMCAMRRNNVITSRLLNIVFKITLNRFRVSSLCFCIIRRKC